MFGKSILAAAVALIALSLAADPGAAQPRVGGGGFRPQGGGPGGGGFAPRGGGFVPQPGPGPGFRPGPGPGPGYGPGPGWGPRPWGWGGIGLYPWGGWGVPLGYYGYWGSYPTFDEVDDMPCLRKVWINKKRWTWRRVC
jgi:hypothetical protein